MIMRKKLASLAFVLVGVFALATPAFAGSVTFTCPEGTHPKATSIVKKILPNGDIEITVTYICVQD